MPTHANPRPTPRRWAWMWFCYTGFLFFAPVIEPTLPLWLGTLAVFAAFAAVFAAYIRLTDSEQPTRFWMIVATFVLGLIAFPWNPGASCFFIYTAAFLPFAVPSARLVFTLFTVESLLIAAETWLFHTPIHGLHIFWPNALIGVFMVYVIGGGQIFIAEQKRADCKLRAAQAENITLAAVAERERIARDLHDVLGHTLSVIVLKAELAKRLLDSNPARAAAEIADVESTARTALAEVREAIGGYRARGLAAEIETARRTLDAAGVTLVLTDTTGAGCPVHDDGTIVGMSGPATNLTPHVETALALALREAVTNIVRHARATTCTLRFVSDSGTRLLIVEDNGATPITREGNGLRGMRERIESLGGHLALEHDSGTRLLITLPTSS